MPVYIAEGEFAGSTGQPKKFAGYRWFESISLQRGVACEPDSSPELRNSSWSGRPPWRGREADAGRAHRCDEALGGVLDRKSPIQVRNPSPSTSESRANLTSLPSDSHREGRDLRRPSHRGWLAEVAHRPRVAPLLRSIGRTRSLRSTPPRAVLAGQNRLNAPSWPSPAAEWWPTPRRWKRRSSALRQCYAA